MHLPRPITASLHLALWPFGILALFLLPACSSSPRFGSELPRKGDEIVVAGRYFHTGAPVVLWTDPGGYDAYRIERRFVPIADAGWDKTSQSMPAPNRYDARTAGLPDDEIEQVRGGGWTLDQLREVVDQFVIHYDVSGTSRACFRTLHDQRRLSIHFMIDIDGTIYQTLDVKERAWHATTSNTRSVGVEMANIGAYKPNTPSPLSKWYAKDADGHTYITIPSSEGDGGVRTRTFVGRPMENDPITGEIQGETLEMYDFTPEQYESLSRLAAALNAVLPRIELTYPTDAEGNLITHKLPDETLKNYRGILGHYHIQQNKADPGPAMQWEFMTDRARALRAGRSAPLPSQDVMHPPL